MPSGFQVWNEKGELIQDSSSDSVGRILGVFTMPEKWSNNITTSTESIQDSRFSSLKGQPFIIPFQNSYTVDSSVYSSTNDKWIAFKISAMTINNLRVSGDKLLFDFTIMARKTVPKQLFYYGLY